jgi:hypothetical protein
MASILWGDGGGVESEENRIRDSYHRNISVLNPLMHFLAMHGHFPGSIDANSHIVALNAQHRDDNVIVDEDAFTSLPAQN